MFYKRFLVINTAIYVLLEKLHLLDTQHCTLRYCLNTQYTRQQIYRNSMITWTRTLSIYY